MQTQCWLCIIEPEEPFIFEVYGPATTDALKDAEAFFAEDVELGIVDFDFDALPKDTVSILCELVFIDTRWFLQPVKPLRIEILPESEIEQAVNAGLADGRGPYVWKGTGPACNSGRGTE